MRRFTLFLLTFLFLCDVLTCRAEYVDTLVARVIKARVDSIYEQLGDADKRMIRDFEVDDTEWQQYLLRSALRDRRFYNSLCRLFGEEIMEVYVDPYATEDLPELMEEGVRRANSLRIPFYETYFPLRTGERARGSYFLYNAAYKLTCNFSSFSNRVYDAFRGTVHRSFMSKGAKDYRVRDMQQLLDLHQYPARYAFLASKDDSLAQFFYPKTFKNHEIFERPNWLQEQIERAQLLLEEKRRTIGEHHPCFALTLSDLAFLRLLYSPDLTEAIRLQTEALNIYSKTGCSDAIKLSAKFLSYLHYLRTYYTSKTSSAGLRRCIKQKKEEISAIVPPLGEEAYEVWVARKELSELESRYERTYQYEIEKKAWGEIDSTYNQLSSQEKSSLLSVLKNMNKLHAYRKYEYGYYFLHSALMGRQMLNQVADVLGKEPCDTIEKIIREKGTSEAYDSTKIPSMVSFLMRNILRDCNYHYMKEGKQYDITAAQSIVDAHRYPARYSYFAEKDDTLAILFSWRKGDQTEKIKKYARQLLTEKQRTIGKHHPGYALTLSDLSYIYFKEAEGVCPYDDGCDSLFEKSIELQLAAMNNYQKRKLTDSYKMSSQTLFYIYDRWLMLSNKPQLRHTERAQRLEKEVLALIQPILGDSAAEVMNCRERIDYHLNYEANLYRNRHESLNDSLFASAVGHYKQNRFAEALAEFETIRKKENQSPSYKFLPSRKDYVLPWIAACYLKLGDTRKARSNDPYYMLQPLDRTKTLQLDYLLTFESDNPQLLTIARDMLGENTTEYARFLINVSKHLVNKSNYEQGAQCLLQSMNICQKLFGNNSENYVLLLQEMVNAYSTMEYYQDALAVLNKIKPLVEQNFGNNSSRYRTMVNQYIEVYKKLNDRKNQAHWAAIRLNTFPTLRQNGKDTEKEAAEKQRARSILHENIGLLLSHDRSDTASVRLATKHYAQAIVEKRKYRNWKFGDRLTGDDNNSLYVTYSIDITIIGTKLISCLYSLNDTTRARLLENEYEAELMSMMNTCANSGKKLSYEYQKCLKGLAQFYRQLAENLIAVQRYQHSIELLEKAQTYHQKYIAISEDSDIKNTYYLYLLKGMANLFLSRHADCVEASQQAMRISEKAGNYTRYYLAIKCMEKSLIALERYNEAADLLEKWWDYKSKDMLSKIVAMNANQREQYWNTENTDFEISIPYLGCLTKQPKSIDLIYDNTLLTKGLLLNTEKEIEAAITENGTEEQRNSYRQLHRNRLRLMYEQQLDKSSRTANLDSLSLVVRSLESELIESLQKDDRANLITSLRQSWRNIVPTLQKKDVAVEFITIHEPKGNDTYYALTLRNGYEHPHLTKLFETGKLNDIKATDYYNSSLLYDMLWKPLEAELKDVKNIYFSPVGALHQVGIEYLPGMERYNTYRLSSTRELLNNGIKKKQKMDVALYGGLKFELTANERAQQSSHKVTTCRHKAFRDTPDLTSLRDLRGAARRMPVLVGSLHEVQDIDSLMQRKRINVATALGIMGTEESFKALSGQKKSLIHISTHGFYQPEPKQGKTDDNPVFTMNGGAQTQEDRSLSRSGLLMTGAADYLFGRITSLDSDDGILTAREISRMDLSGLDLVVLSACETGLGDISGEGVFGLQRGFKKAGAQTLLVSLWKVEDDATQLLMTEFYRCLLSGKTKRQAFLAAQQKLRSAEGGRFNRYECWAAFVMIDALR